jgi:hypothetical protein
MGIYIKTLTNTYYDRKKDEAFKEQNNFSIVAILLGIAVCFILSPMMRQLGKIKKYLLFLMICLLSMYLTILGVYAYIMAK